MKTQAFKYLTTVLVKRSPVPQNLYQIQTHHQRLLTVGTRSCCVPMVHSETWRMMADHRPPNPSCLGDYWVQSVIHHITLTELRFTSHITQNRSFQRRSSQPISSPKKLNQRN